MSTLDRDVRFLKRYAILSTLAFGTLAIAAFRPQQNAKFEVIDVERINILEPDGKYRMIISNRPRSTGPIYKGKPFGYEGGGRPGMIFFNDEGTENGGFTFNGMRGPDGKYRSSLHLSFDQYNSDQVMTLNYLDENSVRQVGMTIEDRPELDIYDLIMERDSIMRIADTAARRAGLAKWQAPRNGVPLWARRVFVGRDRQRSAVVNLAAPDGRTRLRLIVDSLGTARIDFLDATGKVVKTLP